MKRIPVKPRAGLAAAAAKHDFEFQEGVGIPYWDESAYYQFTPREIEEDLEGPATEIEGLCFQVVARAMEDETVFRRLGIAEFFWDYIADSWQNQEKNLYGRMDFSYDGNGPAKLLEYNADTPTTLYESAVFQWEWLEEATQENLLPEGCDQFNDIHEKIVASFPHLGITGPLHLASNQDVEDDRGTLDYIGECAKEAGLTPLVLAMEDIGMGEDSQFTDLDDRVISSLFKLYPWEWIMEEEFGLNLPASGVRFIEPPWRAILSNKGLLPLLWEMFEGHPNLLPAYFDGDPAASAIGDSYVRKPLLSRQGANIEIVRDGKTELHNEGPYGAEGHIVQAFHPLPDIDGNFPLIGCWLIASQAVGLGIREDTTLVTGKNARFVPHVILD
ncbi:MAG: glutathionylspermidine synthase family protein [Rhodospirillaceae bacterium]|jgi:glutathionylspermidine synthase|nr:glutathionylspermidine synthase family protein [Rhodospirillaceae bacterium]MBT5459224.1 glutathionylspermidine synthase family protein [Rhodospirillaceae bacterium]